MPAYKRAAGSEPHPQEYTTPQEAYAQGMRQMDVYERLAVENPHFRSIRTQADLADVLANFGGVDYFPYDPAWRLTGKIDRDVSGSSRRWVGGEHRFCCLRCRSCRAAPVLASGHGWGSTAG